MANVSVPQPYSGYISQASSGTGVPFNVIAEQASVESGTPGNPSAGFNPRAVSPAGAEGWLQFLPSTYDAYASSAGVPKGTEFNPADETKVYTKYMNALLKQTGGNIRNALSLYNSGSINSSAGQAYASEILKFAGMSGNPVASGGTGSAGGSSSGGSSSGTMTLSATDPFPGGKFDPLNWPFELGNAAANAVQQTLADTLKKIEKDIWAKLRPLLIRLGLILLGALIVYAGINGLLKSESAGPTQITTEAGKSAIKRARA